MGICEILFVVFLVLKLIGTITWSWWLVTSPLWVTPVILIGYLFFTVVGGTMITGIIDKRNLNKKMNEWDNRAAYNTWGNKHR